MTSDGVRSASEVLEGEIVRKGPFLRPKFILNNLSSVVIQRRCHMLGLYKFDGMLMHECELLTECALYTEKKNQLKAALFTINPILNILEVKKNIKMDFK